VNRDSERSIESLSLALASSHLAALASHSGIEFKILRNPRTNRQRSAVSRHDPLEFLVGGVQRSRSLSPSVAFLLSPTAASRVARLTDQVSLFALHRLRINLAPGVETQVEVVGRVHGAASQCRVEQVFSRFARLLENVNQ
jgi:hypothetical protein